MASLESATDLTKLAVFRAQKARPSRFADPTKTQGFPRAEFGYVKAYVYHFLEATALDSHQPGCESRVLSSDGRLCPSVVGEGAMLDPAQTQELLSVAQLPKATTQTGCGFEPRHAFVFYNVEDAPVAAIDVYLKCGRWQLSGFNETDMPTGAARRIEMLLQSLHLPGLTPEFSESDEDAFLEEYLSWKHSGALRRPSDLFAIPKGRKISEMSDPEKQRLCAWRIAEIASGHFGLQRSGWTIDHAGTFWLRDYDECIERFPNCERTLGEVEQVDLRLGRDDRFVHATDCLVSWIFGPNGHCLWGIDRDCGNMCP